MCFEHFFKNSDYILILEKGRYYNAFACFGILLLHTFENYICKVWKKSALLFDKAYHAML